MQQMAASLWAAYNQPRRTPYRTLVRLYDELYACNTVQCNTLSFMRITQQSFMRTIKPCHRRHMLTCDYSA